MMVDQEYVYVGRENIRPEFKIVNRQTGMKRGQTDGYDSYSDTDSDSDDKDDATKGGGINNKKL